MDCIYCGIRKQMLLQQDALDSNFLYEYTVCLYENYMAKLFHSICAMYDLESQERVEIVNMSHIEWLKFDDPNKSWACLLNH